LALHQVTLGFLHASAALDRFALRDEPLSMPVQLMLAEQDQIVDNRSTRMLVERVAMHRRIIEYPGARHTLELDHCREAYLRDLIDFINGGRGAAPSQAKESS
jgi:alpha-beta hydrolase superfamily lysophospholipase